MLIGVGGFHGIFMCTSFSVMYVGSIPMYQSQRRVGVVSLSGAIAAYLEHVFFYVGDVLIVYCVGSDVLRYAFAVHMQLYFRVYFR